MWPQIVQWVVERRREFILVFTRRIMVTHLHSRATKNTGTRCEIIGHGQKNSRIFSDTKKHAMIQMVLPKFNFPP